MRIKHNSTKVKVSIRLSVTVCLLFQYALSAQAWEISTQSISAPSETTRNAANAGVHLPQELNVPHPDDSAVSLGEGFDLITGQRRPAYCVTAGIAQRIPFNDRSLYFSEVLDEESLLRKLNVSLSASANYAGYSGGGSYKSSVETRSSSKDINIIAQAALKTYAITMKVPEARLGNDQLPTRRFDLSPAAISLAKSNPAEFRRVCGDGYVFQITYGADFYTRFKFSELTFAQKTVVEASLKASGPAGVFSVDGSTKQETEFNSNKVTTKLEVFERGGAAPAALPYDRATVVRAFADFGVRAKDNERPLFITIRRYSSLPSIHDLDFIVVADQLDIMVKRALRLRSLLSDYDDVIYQLQGGGDKGFATFEAIESNVRELAGYIQQRERLVSVLETARANIKSCVEEQTTTSCQLGDNNSDSWASGPPNKITTSDDLEIRGIAPLAVNRLSPNQVFGLQEYIARGGFLKQTAACNVIEAIQRENVQHVDALRCQDGECVPLDRMNEYKKKVFEGFDAITDPVECEPILIPAPAPAVGQKGLGSVLVRRGQSFSVKGDVTGSKGYNDFTLELNCPSGRSSLGRFATMTAEYPKLFMDCLLEVRGDRGNGSWTVLKNTRPSENKADRRYTFFYDDEARGKGEPDYNDLIVTVTLSPVQ